LVTNLNQSIVSTNTKFHHFHVAKYAEPWQYITKPRLHKHQNQID